MDIQRQFITTVTQPSNECLAWDIKNQCRGSFDPKLLVLLHWTKNLGNLLSPQKIGTTMEADLMGSC